MGLFSFSIVRYRVNRVRASYRSKGLKSQLITLDNGSTMHCWTQSDVKVVTKRNWRGRAQAPPSKPLPQKPALLFIHGFGGDGTIGWEHQIAYFTKDYRVIVPDLLFFGASSTTNTQRTEIFQADCIHDMLSKLGVEETDVVGTSYGGFVAFWMAYKYPRLCRKVVLSSSGVCMNPTTNDHLLKQFNLSFIGDILLPTTVDGLKLAFSLLYVNPQRLPDFILQQVLDKFYSVEDRAHRIELLNAIVIGSKKCPPLPQLTQQVLIIWGREDQIFKPALAHQLQEHLGMRNAQVAFMEGVGHMPQVERPKEYNAIISDFLDDTPPEDLV